jgi:hypothetical protein
MACKHEGAVHRGRTRCTSQTARVTLIGSVCSSRIIELSELSKGHCSQSRRCLQMVVGLTGTRYNPRGQWDEHLSAGRFDHSPMAVCTQRLKTQTKTTKKNGGGATYNSASSCRQALHKIVVELPNASLALRTRGLVVVARLWLWPSPSTDGARRRLVALGLALGQSDLAYEKERESVCGWV